MRTKLYYEEDSETLTFLAETSSNNNRTTGLHVQAFFEGKIEV